MPDTPKKSRALLLVTVALTIVGWFPVVSVLLSTALANIGQCTVNEGGVTPCKVFGLEMGKLLAELFVAGWYFLLTAPLAVASVVFWIILLVRALGRRRQPG